MRTRIIPVILVLAWTMLCFLDGPPCIAHQSSQPPVLLAQATGQPPIPYPPVQGEYGALPQPPSGYHSPAVQNDGETDSSGWPNYPYPPYHNPYYQGVSPRDMFSGTLDWLLAFPSTVMERVSGFMDRSFFPPSPAAQGGASQLPSSSSPQPQMSHGPEPSLPPAGPSVPGSQ